MKTNGLFKTLYLVAAIAAAGIGSTRTASAQASANIDIGTLSAAGTGYSISGNVVYITANGDYYITGSTSSNRVEVSANVTANITIEDLHISPNSGSPFTLSATAATVYLTLAGDNTLTGAYGYAGLYVPSGAALTVTVVSTGSLSATGGDADAGIGGCYGYFGNGIRNCGTVTIDGGTVNANGGEAGIGGGYQGNGGTVTITGGTVNATGGSWGAGIGGGYQGNGGTVTITGGTVKITGGTVTAKGGSLGAGIGGGGSDYTGGSGGAVTITGGTVTATGGAAGIGGGYGRYGNGGGYGGTVIIDGGTVIATGGYNSAGIGGGYNVGGGGNGGTVTINGGTVIATGGWNETFQVFDYGGGIGGARGHTDVGTVKINGGSVLRIGSDASYESVTTNSANDAVYLATLKVGAAANTAITAGDIDGTPCAQTPSTGVYGIRDVHTDDAGKVYFWLPESSNDRNISLEANGDTYSCDAVPAEANNNNIATLLIPLSNSGNLSSTVTYDGSAIDLTSLFTIDANAGARTYGIDGGSGTGTIAGSMLTVTSAGTFTVGLITAATDSYQSGAKVTSSLTVNKGAPTVTAAPVFASSLVFDGTAQALVTTAGSTTGGTMEYSLDGMNYGATLPSATDADTYTVYYRVDGGALYNDVAAVGPHNVTIGKGTPTVTAPTAASPTYNGAAQALLSTSGSTSGGTLEYSLDGSAYSSTVPTGTNVGNYTVYYRVIGGTNYNDVAAATLTANILPLPITITPDAGQRKLSGEADPTPFTYTYSPALVGGDYLTGALQRVAGEAVGNYAYTIGSITVSSTPSNYALSVASAPQFTIGAIAPVLLNSAVVALPPASIANGYSVNVVTLLDITGTPTPTVTVTGLPDGLTYSGGVISGTPAAIGTYQITVTATNPGGTVTATFTLTVSFDYSNVSRLVELVVADGFLTDYAPGLRWVPDKTDFLITITPPADQPDLKPSVTTSRNNEVVLTHDAAANTWLARVRYIWGNTTIRVQASDPTGVATVATDDDTRVWAFDGKLHVVCRACNVSTVQVYTLTGTRIIEKPLTDGETTIALPHGVYIVKTGEKVRKITL